MMRSENSSSFGRRSSRAEVAGPEPDQMARAWAIALLRRSGEPLSEENISRTISKKPKFSAIARAGAPHRDFSPKKIDPPEPRMPPEHSPSLGFDDEGPYFRPGHIVHDPETAMARAWATAQLRRNGEVITEENLQRILQQKHTLPAEVRPHTPPTRQFSDDSLKNVVSHRDSAEATVRSLEARVDELHEELTRAKHTLREARQSETEARQQQAQTLEDLEDFKRREQQTRKELQALSDRAAEADFLRKNVAKLESELAEARTTIEEFTSRVEGVREEAARAQNLLREAKAAHRQELQDTLHAAENREKQLLNKISQLESAHADALENARQRERQQGGFSATEKHELERLRRIVNEISGFESEPNPENRRVLVETLENELTLCLKREAALQARAREIAQAETEPGENLPVSNAERKRLHDSLEFLRGRIEALSTLIAESMAFIRSRHASDKNP